MAKITIFGLPGTGTSTVGKKLAKDLGYTYLSSGAIFRQYAADLGMDLYDFVALCAQDPQYDHKLDKEIEEFGKNNDNFVVESRLAWHFIPDSFKIKLVCDFDERIRRVARRDGVNEAEAKKKTVFREETGIKSYAVRYGITEFAPDAVFDVIIDTTSTPAHNIIERIKAELSNN